MVISVSAAESVNSSETYSLPDSLCLVYSVTGKTDTFEDPSYVPDPVSLLGPISESLDTFLLVLGTRISLEIVISSVPSSSYGPISPLVDKPTSCVC